LSEWGSAEFLSSERLSVPATSSANDQRDRIADALEALAAVLLFEEDRQKAVAEAEAARAEAMRIRVELRESI
jgi:hypothetical protein